MKPKAQMVVHKPRDPLPETKTENRKCYKLQCPLRLMESRDLLHKAGEPRPLLGVEREVDPAMALSMGSRATFFFGFRQDLLLRASGAAAVRGVSITPPRRERGTLVQDRGGGRLGHTCHNHNGRERSSGRRRKKY